MKSPGLIRYLCCKLLGGNKTLSVFKIRIFRCDKTKFSVIMGIMFHGYGRSPGAVEVESA